MYLVIVRGPPLEYWRGPGVFYLTIFVGKMGERNKWPCTRHGGNTAYPEVKK